MYHAVAMLGLMAVTVGPGQEVVTARVPVDYVSPTYLRLVMMGGSWWTTSDQVYMRYVKAGEDELRPQGVDLALPYDVDNCFIVRGTPKGIAEFTKRVHATDIGTPTLAVSVRVVPELRVPLPPGRRTGTVPVEQLSAARRYALVARNHVPTQITVGPSAYGTVKELQDLEQERPNPAGSYPDIPTPWYPTTLEITPHVEPNGTVSILCWLSSQDAKRNPHRSVKRVNSIRAGEKTRFKLAISDPGHPVQAYVVEFTHQFQSEKEKRVVPL
jgi:hypothetical protein